jgi:hypothetical protein
MRKTNIDSMEMHACSSFSRRSRAYKVLAKILNLTLFIYSLKACWPDALGAQRHVLGDGCRPRWALRISERNATNTLRAVGVRHAV